MPYKNTPELRYRLFGGLNTKISQYLNSPMEFLTLENLDFQQPGSLTSRWGSTQYFGNSLSGKVTGIYEFNKTTGESYLLVSSGGTLGGATLNGFAPLFSGSTAGTSYFKFWGSTFIDGFSINSFDLDFDTLQDNVFISNQKSFFKSTGPSFYFFGLPRAAYSSLQSVVNPDTIALAQMGVTATAGGFSGYYYYKAAWVNSYGMAGAAPLSYGSAYTDAIQCTGFTGVAVSLSGGDVSNGTSPSILAPPNFDITGVAIFRAGPFASLIISPLLFSYYSDKGATVLFNSGLNQTSFYLQGVAGISAKSTAATFIDSTTQGATQMNANIIPWNWYLYQMGPTFGLYNTAGTGMTIIPKFVESHDNRLFMAGFSNAPSTYGFSEDSEPEHIEADSFFDVRTQDGQPITAMKEYNGNLMLFKTNSFHQLSTASTDPANWILTPISTEYGCLGNRAVTTYANMLVFLDRKGVIQFNGANINILSTKIDPIFQRMNLASAGGAVMTYDKQRNQVLCDIPVDGATMNNLTAVYDIINNAWTTYKGYNSAATAIAQGSLSTKQVFYGGYSGLISYFGSSFVSDNGVGFTCVAKSGFFTDLGESVTKVFRRLFLDSTPVGSSSFIDINLYQDYGSSRVVSSTMMLNSFQSRIDFGVSAKSLSVEFMCGSTIGLALHGFAVQYRFQRNV